MKFLEYTLDGKYITTHKDCDKIPTDYDLDEIIKCIDNKQLSYKDRIWVTPDTTLGQFNKKLMVIRNQR